MTLWSDVSQYQSAPVDDSYPHPFFSYRTNSGDATDALALENGRRAKAMLDSGKIKGVFPYYFFRPGQANCDLHKTLLEQAGLWGHPLVATMVDVEDAGGVITGDHSAEINDEVNRLREWYGNDKKVFGYLNAVSNAGLWRTLPVGMRFVTPNYTGQPGVLSANVPQWMRDRMFAHQFTDRASTLPWRTGTDLNYSALNVEQIQELLGLKNGGSVSAVEDGAGQLRNGFNNHRKPGANAANLPSSYRDADGPWPNDVWAAISNEVVWDGYTEDDSLADTATPKTLVGLVLTVLARQKRLEAKIDKLSEGK